MIAETRFVTMIVERIRAALRQVRVRESGLHEGKYCGQHDSEGRCGGDPFHAPSLIRLIGQ
jgi:hypothetical protein